ncbi:hypothetical protein ABN228_18100 [Providencia rettgeri]|uniref:phage tail fiber protein n=1 Tax=Providencia rettgeri TaxID=587 RepID=UPI0032DAA772
MYSTGTVTTTANSTKLVGTNTKWLNNINRVSAEQAIQIQIGTTVHNNSIHSIQSDTELTLNFPLPTSVTGAKYVILTTMVHSVSDAMNKIVSMNGANVQFSDILTRWMTEQGIITVTLPDQTTQQLRTTKEMDKQLDGKFDKDNISQTAGSSTVHVMSQNAATKNFQPKGDYLKVGMFGFGGEAITVHAGNGYNGISQTSVVRGSGVPGSPPDSLSWGSVLHLQRESGRATQIGFWKGNIGLRSQLAGVWDDDWVFAYTAANTTKDSQGNLKVASPIVKVFADHIELNEESEGVEMEHLGIGHYLIKGVVGFNADGAWGINNGFVIPQDHNGKNMVLIDYEVRPDGDIEIFVFHQQNADMPERFQNKRIKHFDEEGVPVYFENYEPCDVPESRWIDMRVEMPPNSLYNQKQAEAERLAKLEAERLAQEEAKRAAEEAERAEQEAAERKQYGLDENSVLL